MTTEDFIFLNKMSPRKSLLDDNLCIMPEKWHMKIDDMFLVGIEVPIIKRTVLKKSKSSNSDGFFTDYDAEIETLETKNSKIMVSISHAITTTQLDSKLINSAIVSHFEKSIIDFFKQKKEEYNLLEKIFEGFYIYKVEVFQISSEIMESESKFSIYLRWLYLDREKSLAEIRQEKIDQILT